MNEGSSDVNVDSPVPEADDAHEINGHNLSSLAKELGVTGVTIEQIFDYATLDEEGDAASSLATTILFYKWLPHSLKDCPYGYHLTCGSTVSHVLLEVILSLDGIKLNSEVRRLKKFLEPMDNILKTSIIYHAYNRTDIGEDMWQYSTFVPGDMRRKMIREFQDNNVPFKVFGIHRRNYRPERHRKRSKVDLAIRSHDYTDFLVEMTKILSRQGTLKHMITHTLNQNDAAADTNNNSESNADAAYPNNNPNGNNNNNNVSDQESVEVRNGKKRRRNVSPSAAQDVYATSGNHDVDLTGDEDGTENDDNDDLHGGSAMSEGDDENRHDTGASRSNGHESDDKRELGEDEDGEHERYHSAGEYEDGRSSVAEKKVGTDAGIVDYDENGNEGRDGRVEEDEEENIIIEDETGTSSGGLTGDENEDI